MNPLKLIISVILIFIHILIGIATINSISPTYDEPVHLIAGYSFIKTGDYRLNVFANAPFSQMWAAIPLIFLKPSLPIHHPYWNEIGRYQYQFSDLFLYKNRVDSEKMLNSARMMILILSVILGIAIFCWANELFGINSAIISLFLWCFAPYFLANGTLVTTDISLTLFYFTSIYFFWKWHKQNNNTIILPVLCGINIGLALVSKHSAVSIFGLIGIILVYLFYSGQLRQKNLARDFILTLVAILFVIFIVYKFNSPLQQYFYGLKKVLKEVVSGRSTFLIGHYSTSGWKYYFLIVFILKTPLAFLLLLIAAPFCRNLIKQEKIMFLLLPVICYFVLSSSTKVQIGHRHILPIYPFLIVLVSGIYPQIKSNILKIIGSVLLLWYALSTSLNHPWHLSYFNELIGSTDNGYKYLTDSNTDWGQGLKALGKYLKKQGISSIYLNYFGTGDPHYYGIKYIPIGFIDNMDTSIGEGHRLGDQINFKAQPKVIFAISSTNLKATYYADKKVFSFLEYIIPEKIIARSILVYNLSNNPAQYKELKELLKR